MYECLKLKFSSSPLQTVVDTGWKFENSARQKIAGLTSGIFRKIWHLVSDKTISLCPKVVSFEVGSVNNFEEVSWGRSGTRPSIPICFRFEVKVFIWSFCSSITIACFCASSYKFLFSCSKWSQRAHFELKITSITYFTVLKINYALNNKYINL